MRSEAAHEGPRQKIQSMMNLITMVVAPASDTEKTTNSTVLRKDISLCSLSERQREWHERPSTLTQKLTIGGAASGGHHPVKGGVMPVEMLTYAALSERLGCSAEAARALIKRLRLPRQRGNNGKALVAVDVTELNHTPRVRTGTMRDALVAIQQAAAIMKALDVAGYEIKRRK
jgi:hypothetical protein